MLTAGDDSSSSFHLRFDPPGVFPGDGDSTCAWREGEGVQSESQHTRGGSIIPSQILAQAVAGLSGRIQIPGIVSKTRAHTAAEYLFLPWTLTTCRAFFMLS